VPSYIFEKKRRTLIWMDGRAGDVVEGGCRDAGRLSWCSDWN
jgi:hypothetical protein